MKKKVVFILGPTGSGKTALAVKLAKKFNGEIISADSRQVYKRLDVGTAKEGVAKISNSKIKFKQNVKYIEKVPQYMIDVAEPEERFTLFDWLEDARLVLEDIFRRGKLPIVVGGTGLYAKALAEGFELRKDQKSTFNNQANHKSKYSREELNKMTLEELQNLAESCKLKADGLDFKNPRRLIRAIEKAQEGTETTKRKPNFDSLILAIDLEREELYSRIDKRVDDRFAKQEMLEEVEGLLKSGVSLEWLRSLGLEYRIISEFIIALDNRDETRIRDRSLGCARDDRRDTRDDEKDEEFKKMAQELKWKTHAFARRQLTWFRKQEGLVWTSTQKEAVKFVEEFIS